MDYAQVDRRYDELKREYLAGSFSSEAFDEALTEMMIQDDQERWWAKSRETGQWHYYDEDRDKWVQADPPGYEASAAPPPLKQVPAQEPQILRGIAAETSSREQPESQPATAPPAATRGQSDRGAAQAQPGKWRRWGIIGVVAAVLLAVGVGVALLLSGSESPPGPEVTVQVPATTDTVARESSVPETEPTQVVEVAPTGAPTEAPTSAPTEAPTVAPTAVPKVTDLPSPTASPSPTMTPVVPPPSAQGMVEINIDTYTATVAITDEMSRFWIDQYEVTNAQYAEFIKETGNEPPASWPDENGPVDKGDHPVEGISWQQAAEYCTWVNKRLPTEAEWQVAARGPYGWLYPWGNESDAVQLPLGHTYPVGSILGNRSFFGVFDMAGNVWEWVDEPYLNPDAVRAGQRVMHGGAATYPVDLETPLAGDPDSSTMKQNAGFRCAADQVAVEDKGLTQSGEETGRLRVLYADDFTDVSAGWPQAEEQADTYFYGYHPTDFYHVEVEAASDCLAVPRQLDFVPTDFMLEAETFVFGPLSKPEGNFQYGVLLRQTSRSKFYAFLISSRTQHWRVLKSSPEGMAIMTEGDESSIRGTEEMTRDKLFVIANGPRMTFFINGHLVADLSDGDYGAGNAGLMTWTFDNTKAHVHNDTFVLWDLPSGAETSEGPSPAPSDYVFDQPVCRGYFSDAKLLLNFTAHTVLPGENLTVVAEQYGTTIEAIIKANDIEDPNRIRSGWSLVIPLPEPDQGTP
jgi:formylglycine-generating enzyme required for sulfatase activity